MSWTRISRVAALVAALMIGLPSASYAASLEGYLKTYTLTAAQRKAIRAAIATGKPLTGLDAQIIRVVSPQGGTEWVKPSQTSTDHDHGGGTIYVSALEIGRDPMLGMVTAGPKPVFPRIYGIPRDVCFAGQHLTTRCPTNAVAIGRVATWTVKTSPPLNVNVVAFDFDGGKVVGDDIDIP